MDLIINLKEYPGLKEKDIVEIYHPENDYPRLLLQVTSVDAPGRTKGITQIIQFVFISWNYHQWVSTTC